MPSPATARDPKAAVPAPTADPISTPVLLSAMLRTSTTMSDLFFSPGRPPTVEVNGRLTPVIVPGTHALTPDDTRRIAGDIIGTNKHALSNLREHGSCDVSYGLPGECRFRVNVFIQ